MGEVNYLRDSATGVTYDLMPKDGGITEAKLSDELQEKLQELELGIGSPLVASTAAEMTDTDKIYVYTGSETGYTSGNWYYYNGSAWTSGGVYNSMALETDKTLQVSGAAADAKVVGDEVSQLKEDLTAEETARANAVSAEATAREAADDAINTTLETKANVNGYYQEMTVGDAEQLVSTVFVEDSVPYQFRTSGGSSDIGDREYDEVVGGSIVWNQNVNGATLPATQTINGISFTNDNDGSISVSGTATSWTRLDNVTPSKTWAAHKYLLCGCPSGGSQSTYSLALRGQGVDKIDTGNGIVWDASSNGYKGICIYVQNGTEIATAIKFKPQLFDLTKMFGSTIADYIYNLEQTTAGAGVAWFKKFFPKDYYAYDAGTMMHVSGLSSHDMVGFNQWDEVWEEGSLNTTTGQDSESSTTIRSKNYIPILPNTSYHFRCGITTAAVKCYYDASKNYIGYDTADMNNTFTTPSNAYYMRYRLASTYGNTYKNDICINLSWDGEYEPYVKHSYPLDDSLTLRGIPKLDSNNQLYYDGDTYAADGTVTRKYGIVDLGTLSWATSGNIFYATGLANTIKRPANTEIANIVCPLYIVTTRNDLVNNEPNKHVAITNTGNVQIIDSTYTTQADFKTAMSGVMLVYELATPTTEEAEPYNEVQIVDDFGTEEYVTTSLVPVGHNTKYANNLRAKLEMAPDSPSDNGDYIVRHANGQNTYVLLTIPTEIPTAPSEDGIYALKCTVASGTPTYTWEAET